MTDRIYEPDRFVLRQLRNGDFVLTYGPNAFIQFPAHAITGLHRLIAEEVSDE